MTTDITIIAPRWLIPVEPCNTVLENHCVVVENGNIVQLCNTQSALKTFPQATLIDRSDHALIPGLINTHTHAAMSLFRGMADDTALMDWLITHIWPAEAKWVDQFFIRDGTELAIAEMLLSGTTCFSDMYLFPDVVAGTAHKMGVRATIGMIVLDAPTAWAKDADEYFAKGLVVHQQVQSLSGITSSWAPHAPYSVSDTSLRRVQKLAKKLKIPVHMHIHETQHEVDEAVASSGIRPLKRLDDLGLLNSSMIAVHATQLEDQEIDLIAERGVHIAHCPNSNAKLASGHCRVTDLLAAGVNVCLGTDSAASNNNLDMFIEMRAAALNAKQVSANPKSLPAWQALEMATINGAKALQIDHQTGSLCLGKAADMIAIDLNRVNTMPVYDPISQIVYSAASSQVSDVWIQGKHLVKQHSLLNFDQGILLQKSARWGEKIALADR